MTIINGYEIAIDEQKLERMITEQTTPVNMIDADFDGYIKLDEGDKKAIKHLINAAKIINDVALEQDHSLNKTLKKALEEAKGNSHAQKALKIFNSLNGVAGINGIDKDPIEIFKGVKTAIGHNFYPEDLTVEEFHDIITKMVKDGEINEVKKILSARTMVRRNNNKLKAIDYTEYFAKEFSDAANELEVAAHYSTNAEFNEFLKWQVQALLQNNDDMDMLADKHWANMQNTPLEFTLSRENYDDQMTPTIFDNHKLANLLEENNILPTPKDMLGARVGIVNEEGTKLLLVFKEHIAKLTKLMPYSDQYEQKIDSGGQIKQTMVDVDLAALQGDYAQCRGGMTIAQNLPNDDKIAIKTGGGRRNVYHRQVRMSKDKQRSQQILDALIEKEFHQYFEDEAEHIFVIGHENGHSLGPDNTYKTALGVYNHIIEENKADVVSITMMPEYVKIGAIDELTLKKIYVTWIVRMLLKAKPKQIEPHRVADLIHFNWLLKHGVIEISENNKIKICFEKMNDAMIKILQKTIEVQLSKSAKEAKKFIDENSEWNSLHEHIAKTLIELGIKPYKEIRMFL